MVLGWFPLFVSGIQALNFPRYFEGHFPITGQMVKGHSIIDTNMSSY
jgi:hypothetical protein